MLWEIEIHPATGHRDRAGERVFDAAAELGLAHDIAVKSAKGFIVQGDDFPLSDVERLVDQLLTDSVVERAVVRPIRAEVKSQTDAVPPLTVLLKPGVMDPVALSALAAARDMDIRPKAMATFRRYWIDGASESETDAIANRLLANDAIENVYLGPLPIQELEVGKPYQFELKSVPIRSLTDDALERLSREGQLYLQLAEMRTIREHFRQAERDPTDVELETIAQTWSEHCSHKTLAGRISYQDEHGERRFENMLKETIFASTQSIREQLGDDDWCVSVFKDNAGVIRFDDNYNLAFKVETHNHPSALEPYGGANTGVGGVIRDVLGTGLGAKPVCCTDVFCFGLPNRDAASADATPNAKQLPPGVLDPRRVMRGVVEGVRDYGNRMGIPTVNGAVYFDERYVGNPLVFCGTVGLLPHDKSNKKVHANDLIVAVGGRTGRDGIHGATFSSAELTSDSEQLSGGAVQIGNAIEEKRMLDLILAARDRDLFHAITDCGAGGFSSAVGEMGEEIGAKVDLEKAPLKYAGLSYTEIWISEAQERMVLAVPEDRWPELEALCQSEDVEATVIGRFVPSGRLELFYQGHRVADLSMEFLHRGRPAVVRKAIWAPREQPGNSAQQSAEWEAALCKKEYNEDLLQVLSSPNVASKEWIVRQYDHEVQGGSVVKPFVGAFNDGPSDAAVLRPILSSRRGVVIACGMNPRYGDYDTYHMAASAIDEAVRNCVAVGADPKRIAILDNFCWGDCERPETLGSLVRAALACQDVATAFSTPFISGKDSLNNEFSYLDADGKRHTISIPPSLLISALGQISDVAKCVTMDLKEPGSHLYIVGDTRDELGGSHFALVNQLKGRQVPVVHTVSAKRTFEAVHRAINDGLLHACHDLSEGGLAVAAAEMAFAGGLGAQLELAFCANEPLEPSILLFSESNSRFLCEVRADKTSLFENILEGVFHARLGLVTGDERVVFTHHDRPLIDLPIDRLKEAWQTQP